MDAVFISQNSLFFCVLYSSAISTHTCTNTQIHIWLHINIPSYSVYSTHVSEWLEFGCRHQLKFIKPSQSWDSVPLIFGCHYGTLEVWLMWGEGGSHLTIGTALLLPILIQTLGLSDVGSHPYKVWFLFRLIAYQYPWKDSSHVIYCVLTVIECPRYFMLFLADWNFLLMWFQSYWPP